MSTRPVYTPLAASDFASAFPGSRKVLRRRPVGRPRADARDRPDQRRNAARLRLERTARPRRPRRAAEAARALGGAAPRVAAGDAAPLRAQGRDHAGDGVHRHPRGLRSRVRALGSRARPRHHSRQHQPPRARADDHRPQLRGEDQRQHRQLGGELVDRRGSRQAALVDAVGRRHGDGSVDRTRHPPDARVDHPQLRRPDRHRPDLPGARESRRTARRPDLGGLSRHARSSRRSRASTTSPSTPACCCATSR